MIRFQKNPYRSAAFLQNYVAKMLNRNFIETLILEPPQRSQTQLQLLREWMRSKGSLQTLDSDI
jgi:hypothetical protein